MCINEKKYQYLNKNNLKTNKKKNSKKINNKIINESNQLKK